MAGDLDAVWKALSDPTRRAILDLLRQGPRTTTEIVDAFRHLTRFGVMKHIDVLREAGLMIRQIYERWVSRYQDFWANKLLRLSDDVQAGRGPKRGSHEQSEDK